MRGVDFGNGQASSFTASVASGSQGGSIEMHRTASTGRRLAHCGFTHGGMHAWQTNTTTVFGASGKRDLYFVFRGEAKGQLFNFDYWRFNKKGAKEPKP